MKQLFFLFVIAVMAISACSQPVDKTAENKALVNRIVDEIWGQKNPDLIDEIYAADYVIYLPDGELRGPEGYRQVYTTYTTAFPDCYFTLEELVAEGDKVTIPYTFHGTHKDDLEGIAPTGKQVEVKGTAILRITGGKVVEERTIFDTLGLMQQIGAVPVPETTMK